LDIYVYNEIANNLNITRVNGHTVGKDVPADAVFTDTVYVHPNTQTDLTATEFTAITVDRQGHVIAGRNPSTLDVDITKNAASADKLKTARKFKFSGVTAADVSFDGTSDVTVNVTAIPANIITESEEKQFMSKAQKDKLAATLTATEIADKITEASSGMEWKEAVGTKSKISTRYPSPKKGWTVSVLDEGNTYQYNGSNWVVVSSSNMPKATATADGKMSKEDKAKLDSIEEGANNYHLPTTLPPSIIAQDPNNRFITDQEREQLSLKKDMSAFLVGTGIFNGTDGTIIRHEFGNTSFGVSITPTVNPNGGLGEVWVKKTNTLVIVYCSGAGKNIEFDYTLTYYN